MPLYLIRQDITAMKCDAIVNAANRELWMGGGVCGAIFRAAGARQLQQACDALSPIHTGEAVITPGFDLPARYVIHAVGPQWDPERPDLCEKQLRSAYTNALRLAADNGCASIAFPLISSGIYGYPKKAALRHAMETIRAFLEDNEMLVWLIVYDNEALEAGEEVAAVRRYVSDNYVAEHPYTRREYDERLLSAERAKPVSAARRSSGILFDALPGSVLKKTKTEEPPAPCAPCPVPADSIDQELDKVIAGADEPFSLALIRLIDAKGLTDTAVYKAANVDRKYFSKIRNGQAMPRKRFILAIAIAMHLNREETESLLSRAGYAFSEASEMDLAVRWCIMNAFYNIDWINQYLFSKDLPLLGSL